MPAKNESSFIIDALNGLLETGTVDWELIIIDDHSEDNTLELAQEVADIDKRIKVYQNNGHGKIAALNYGYELSRKNIIKCIDADDLLSKKFFKYSINHNFDAMCHNAFVVDVNLKRISSYIVSKKIINAGFNDCLRELVSIPRWSWSFTRKIGDKIFPLPNDLPFEDVWFSLAIKRFADSIKYVPENLYYYRQNNNQTYGGVLNFSNEIIIFRANRMLRLIAVLEKEVDKRLGCKIGEDYFSELLAYYELLSQKELKFRTILAHDISKKLKSKALLYKKASFAAPTMHRVKWLIDGMLSER